MIVSFTVGGAPVPKQRPRRGKGGHFYTPRKTKNYELAVGMAAIVARPRGWDKGASYSLRVEVYTPSRRVDVDNVVKSIADGLNGVLWADDAQVVEVVARKHVDTENPRAVVEVVEVAL